VTDAETGQNERIVRARRCHGIDRRAFGRQAARLLLGLVIVCIGLTPLQAAAQRQVPQSQAQVQLSFAPVVQQAAPAVVNIFAKKVVEQRARGGLFNDPFFRRFFGDNFMPNLPRRRVENSLGSGVIVQSDGLIVTNHHVIDKADEIQVVLNDRREFDATLVLTDERTDLAILRVDPRGERLPSLSLADSDGVQVGDIVLAIGNPFGVGQTVTSGIVSGLARTTVGISDFNFFIQTDAAINPGNSGGALVGMDGRLIGVNTAIYSRDGGSSGIGFAVPTNMVRTVINAALSDGTIRRPWIGVSAQPVTQDIAQSLGLRRPTGVIVKAVHPSGPAADAGLRQGDVLLTLDGKEVTDPEALRFRLATEQVGTRVRVGIVRNGRQQSVPVTLESPPEVPPRNLTIVRGRSPFAGSKIGNLSPAFAEELGIDSTLNGVIIVEVARNGPAARRGMRPGDIVQSVNGRSVRTVRELERAVSDADRTWEIRLRRGDETVNIRARG